jgi:hypothetical protein
MQKNKTKTLARTASTRPTRKPGATAGKNRAPRAKNAYELLGRVAREIPQHPEAYFKHDWQRPVHLCPMSPRVQAKNECGTAFCRAGWIVGLHDGFEKMKANPTYPIASRADAILGLFDDETHELFYDESVDVARPGTRAYARIGAAGVRAFMEKHAKHLKARSLKGV